MALKKAKLLITPELFEFIGIESYSSDRLRRNLTSTTASQGKHRRVVTPSRSRASSLRSVRGQQTDDENPDLSRSTIFEPSTKPHIPVYENRPGNPYPIPSTNPFARPHSVPYISTLPAREEYLLPFPTSPTFDTHREPPLNIPDTSPSDPGDPDPRSTSAESLHRALHSQKIAKMSTSTESPKTKIKIPLPQGFTGASSKYRRFKTDLRLYFSAHKVTEDQDKIIIALSCMTDNAGTWAQIIAERATATDPPRFGKWEDFVEIMDHRFQDNAQQYKARKEVEEFKQGKRHIDEYIHELERLFLDANLKDENERIRLLKHGVHPSLVRSIIVNSNQRPETYDEWRDSLLNLGRHEEEYGQEFGYRSQQTPAQSYSRQPPAPTPQPRQPHTFIVNVPDKKNNTGITYGGAGQPMEIDRLRNVRCFGCNQLGHMRPNCPNPGGKKAMNIREVLLQFTEEERDELFLAAREDELQKDDDEREQDFLMDQ